MLASTKGRRWNAANSLVGRRAASLEESCGQQVDRIPDAPLRHDAVGHREQRHHDRACEPALDARGHRMHFQRQHGTGQMGRGRTRATARALGTTAGGGGADGHELVRSIGSTFRNHPTAAGDGQHQTQTVTATLVTSPANRASCRVRGRWATRSALADEWCGSLFQMTSEPRSTSDDIHDQEDHDPHAVDEVPVEREHFASRRRGRP